MIVDKVREIADEIITEKGLELVHLEFQNNKKDWVLRLYIDKEGGVTITDCQKVSKQLSYELDVLDFIPHGYSLEVSSPGIDRIVSKRKDFDRFKGEKIKISLSRTLNDRKKYNGKLLGLDDKDDTVHVETDTGLVKLPFKLIKKANLIKEIDFK